MDRLMVDGNLFVVQVDAYREAGKEEAAIRLEDQLTLIHTKFQVRYFVHLHKNKSHQVPLYNFLTLQSAMLISSFLSWVEDGYHQ